MKFLKFSEDCPHGKTTGKQPLRAVLLTLVCAFLAFVLLPCASALPVSAEAGALSIPSFSAAAVHLFPHLNASEIEEETNYSDEILFDPGRKISVEMVLLQISQGRQTKVFTARLHQMSHWLLLACLFTTILFFRRKACFCHHAIFHFLLLLNRILPVRAGPCA